MPEGARVLCPLDRQEVWASCVTYERSREARKVESEGGGDLDDRVYEAGRPELFFKAAPRLVRGPGEPLRIRRDSSWNVPEPELREKLASAAIVAAVREAIGPEPWVRDAIIGRPEIVDGYFALPDQPGLGVDLNEEVIRQHPPLEGYLDFWKAGWERRNSYGR